LLTLPYMAKKGKILVVDDNRGIREALKILLGAHFEQVELLSSPVTLLRTVETLHPDVILLDMNFRTDINTGNEGLYYLSEIKEHWPEQAVVLFTAYADIALAVEGMKRGAEDFIVKPWDNARLIETLTAIRDRRSGKPKATKEETQMFWGDSPEMKKLRSDVEKIAATDATVLITGENGTGKDVLAHEIHRLSHRSGRPMVCVDAGAITETLFESELFGHVKGAFTDARTDHEGKFEQADGGTLFLDEIANIPVQSQAKLLRVIQSRCVTRVGDTRSIPVDIRLICATNADIPSMIRGGLFREDLYYRLNTISLQIPPLRNRIDGIVPLAMQFVEEFSQRYSRNVTSLSQAAQDELRAYSWPGNIRELRNCIEKAVILSDSDQIESFGLTPVSVPNSISSRDTMEDMEEKTIRAAMERCGGNISMVAKSLNISRPTLYSKLKKYGI
jgi:two-component system, NtrC family, response regulator HydG